MGESATPEPEAVNAQRFGLDGADSAEIQTLVAAYFQRTDRLGPEGVAELFVPDGLLMLGSLMVDGRDAIADFFAQRNIAQTEAGRITRHISSGLELTPIDSRRMKGRSTVLVFAGNGELPLSAGTPSTICDFDDIYVRGPVCWLFQERRASVIFTGAGAASFAK